MLPPGRYSVTGRYDTYYNKFLDANPHYTQFYLGRRTVGSFRVPSTIASKDFTLLNEQGRRSCVASRASQSDILAPIFAKHNPPPSKVFTRQQPKPVTKWVADTPDKKKVEDQFLRLRKTADDHDAVVKKFVEEQSRLMQEAAKKHLNVPMLEAPILVLPSTPPVIVSSEAQLPKFDCVPMEVLPPLKSDISAVEVVEKFHLYGSHWRLKLSSMLEGLKSMTGFISFK